MGLAQTLRVWNVETGKCLRTLEAPDAGQVYGWAHECAQFILAEQHSWYRLIPLLRLDL